MLFTYCYSTYNIPPFNGRMSISCRRVSVCPSIVRPSQCSTETKRRIFHRIHRNGISIGSAVFAQMTAECTIYNGTSQKMPLPVGI